MVRDKASVIVGEQMLRLRNRILSEITRDPSWEPPEYVVMGPEIPLDIVAFGIAAVRVTRSAKWN